MENKTLTKYRFDEKKHVHLLDEKILKGTTTVIKEVLPPPLAWYGSGMACKMLGWYDRKQGRTNYLSDEEGMPELTTRLNLIKTMTPEEYLGLLDRAYQAHDEYKKEKGDWGKETHSHIEKVVREAISVNEGQLSEKPYENEAVERFASWGRGKKFLFSEVHVYSEKLWLGGIIDLVYEDDGIHLGDVKTGKRIYEGVFIQDGMYDYQQEENGFLSSEGEVLGKPVKIKGYTAINIPREGGVKEKTYYDTERMCSFAEKLVELHSTLTELKSFI